MRRVRWRPWGIGLALLLIAVGTPAREAEAASDLARTVAEIGEPGRCEEVDGGVGDDQIEGLRPDTLSLLHPASPDGVGPPRAGCTVDLFPLSARPDRPIAPARTPFATPTARLAWLQRFLF